MICLHWPRIPESSLFHDNVPKDDALRQAVEINSHKSFRKSWTIISQSVPGRTGKQCYGRWRWNENIKPDLVIGSWTDEEDVMLEKMVKDVGMKWSAIGSHLPGKFSKQCRDRWHERNSPKVATASEESRLASSNIDDIVKLPLAFGFWLDDRGASKKVSQIATERGSTEGTNCINIAINERVGSRSTANGSAVIPKVATASDEIKLNDSNRGLIATLPVAFGFWLGDCDASKQLAQTAIEKWSTQEMNAAELECFSEPKGETSDTPNKAVVAESSKKSPKYVRKCTTDPPSESANPDFSSPILRGLFQREERIPKTFSIHFIPRKMLSSLSRS